VNACMPLPETNHKGDPIDPDECVPCANCGAYPLLGPPSVRFFRNDPVGPALNPAKPHPSCDCGCHDSWRMVNRTPAVAS
jgi:hypothetical protein